LRSAICSNLAFRLSVVVDVHVMIACADEVIEVSLHLEYHIQTFTH
jgi:hypothetical protein